MHKNRVSAGGPGLSLLAGAALAICGAGPAMAAPLHPYLLAQATLPGAATPDAVDPLYRAMAQMALGDPAKACATLEEHFPDERVNADVLLLKGRCLYRSGRHAEAVTAYERLSALQGDVYLVRYELARAYAAAGQRSAARSEFERVLQLNPPPILGVSVQRELDALASTGRPWAVDASAAYVYDGNVNAGPSSSTFQAFGLPFEVAPGDRPKRADGFLVGMTGRYLVELTPDAGILFRGGASAVRYDDSDFGTATVSAGVGPIMRVGAVTLAVEPTVVYQWLSNDEERVLAGPTARVRWAVDERLQLGVDGAVYWMDYRRNRDRNGHLASAGAVAEYALLPNLRVGAGDGLEEEQTRSDVLSSVRHGPLAVFSWRPVPELGVTASYQHQWADYRGRDPAFPETRSDDIHTARLGLNWDTRQVTGIEGLEFRSEYSWRETASNIGIFDSRRHYLQVGFGYSF